MTFQYLTPDSLLTEQVTPQIEATSNSMSEASATVEQVNASTQNTTKESIKLNTLAQKLSAASESLKSQMGFFETH